MKNKILFTGVILALSFSSFALANYNDDIDQNATPAPLEARENEMINQGDMVDRNCVPSTEEERLRQEEVESDLIQSDDPERTYDQMDEEYDD